MPNEDEYQKSLQTKIRYCLGASQFPISLLITCTMAEQTDFEIGLFHNFGPSWPWPWIGSNGIPSCSTYRPL